jgi:hypothetical protein
MPTTNLKFQPVPSVPNLKIAEGLQTDSGAKLIAFTTGTDIVHVVSADGALKGFGGLTVIGPNVTTVAMNWKDILKKAFAAVGGGGGLKLDCTQTSTVVVEGGKSTTTTTQHCTAG